MRNFLQTGCGLVLLLTIQFLPNNGVLLAQPGKLAPSIQVSTYTFKIIQNPNHTYGYDVYASGKLLIHQPTIPAVAGTTGFITKNAAEAVAGLVLKKIQKGEMPPTVTVEEMRKLNALP